MARATWDPAQYLRFAASRARPFFDLLAPVEAETPRHVVDAGCGPGNLTVTLADRWPTATVLGFDSSPEMVARAAEHTGPRVRFTVDDATTWQPETRVDVLVSNALLHWIPDHDRLAVRWLSYLAPGGWLAFQVPGNFTSPSHQAIGEVLERPRWRAALPEGVAGRAGSFDPAHYLGVLADAGAVVDAWETTYLHVLDGPAPVLEWIKGTALRPVLDALDTAGRRDEFLAELNERLVACYPPGPHGTVFPFRRVFVVARAA
ncbi:MAG TPA: trans-aconitate 2-methyltransferase [Acidimicrobiia bacterium]|nr:trans-aconitate 2-methyltransferase [Acidimicrobiia bacterium]